MYLAKLIITAGFLISGIGWLFGAFLYYSELGNNMFFIGFYLAVVGILTTQVLLKVPKEQQHASVGLKIGSIGFGICSLTGLFELLDNQSPIANYIFTLGSVIFFTGLIVLILNVKNKN
jgi:protein-S-isoprenylcysteine O-methyltransferase Ste14